MNTKLLFLVLLFFTSLYGKAQMQNQDSIFMANIWRLQKLEINQNIIPAPNNSELSFPKLTPYAQNQFTTEGCGGGSATFYFVNNSELFIDEYVVFAMMCVIPSNNVFSGHYDHDFIYFNMLNSFEFIITDHTTYLELIIIGQNGNKAYYHNNLSVSINEMEIKEKIRLYPNPVTDTFFISGNEQILGELKEIVLYDFSGKLVFKKAITDSYSWDISHLASGSYVVCFTNDTQLFNYSLIIKR